MKGADVALPPRTLRTVMSGGETLGALAVYSGRREAFDPEETKLLAQLAGDLAYGLATLRTRAERLRAEEMLRESERREEDEQGEKAKGRTHPAQAAPESSPQPAARFESGDHRHLQRPM